jgi:acyl carrier protein
MTIEDTVRTYLVDELGCPGTIEEDTPLIKSGYLDSARLVELALFVQDVFAINLPPGDFATDRVEANFGSLAKIVTYLRTKGGAR